MEDIGARFKKLKAAEVAEQDTGMDMGEFYRLRAKMLGVLMRDARLSAARTESDCARIMGIPVENYLAWEYGDVSPTLPQLEILAFYLGVPVSQFWSQNTLKDEYVEESRAEDEYIRIRTRIIGALLQQAREESQITQEQLADDTGLAVERIRQYETGEPIPMHELGILARGVNKPMPYFLEASGRIGELLDSREKYQKFVELPEDIREFVSNPVNQGFIEIAIMFSKMPTDKLRSVGSSIVDITM
ncbi:MAG: helix-turn-helix transcriptional regulator [Chloroflexota bacterium]